MNERDKILRIVGKRKKRIESTRLYLSARCKEQANNSGRINATTRIATLGRLHLGLVFVEGTIQGAACIPNAVHLFAGVTPNGARSASFLLNADICDATRLGKGWNWNGPGKRHWPIGVSKPAGIVKRELLVLNVNYSVSKSKCPFTRTGVSQSKWETRESELNLRSGQARTANYLLPG